MSRSAARTTRAQRREVALLAAAKRVRRPACSRRCRRAAVWISATHPSTTALRFWIDDSARGGTARRRGPHRGLLRAQAPQDRHPVSDSGRVLARGSRRPTRRSGAIGSGTRSPPCTCWRRCPRRRTRARGRVAESNTIANGEVIVREGEPGDSMFIVIAGAVAISVGPEQREVAVTNDRRVLRRDVTADRRPADRDGHRARRLHGARNQRR